MSSSPSRSRRRHRSSRSSSSGDTLLRLTMDGHLYREPSNESPEAEAAELYQQPHQFTSSLTSDNTNQTSSYQQRALLTSIPTDEHTALVALRQNSTNIDQLINSLHNGTSAANVRPSVIASWCNDLQHVLECIKLTYGGSPPSKKEKFDLQEFNKVIDRIDKQSAKITKAHTKFYAMYKAGDTAVSTEQLLSVLRLTKDTTQVNEHAQTLLKILDDKSKAKKLEEHEDKKRSMEIAKMWTDNAANLVEGCAKITSESLGGDRR